MDVTQILLGAQDPRNEVRNHAEQQLQAMQAQNLGLYAVEMAKELATEGKPERSRWLAGINLKNLLDGKSDAESIRKQDAWRVTPPELREQVKGLLLQGLGSAQRNIAHTAAQAIAAVAATEVSLAGSLEAGWRQLFPSLISGAGGENHTRIAALEAIGFTCEELDSELVKQEQINEVLTAVVSNMSHASPEVAEAATKALLNMLEFTRNNFEVPGERRAIMNAACASAKSASKLVRVAGFEVLVYAVARYYDKLQEHMQDIFQLTLNAIRSDEDEVSQVAMEFWCGVAEEEGRLQADDEEALEDYREAVAAGQPAEEPKPQCVGYLRGALKPLTQLLLAVMQKQPEPDDVEEDTFTPSMRAATTLSVIAETAGEAIANEVMPFVTAHVQDGNWHLREAAVMAFGTLMESVRTKALGATARGALPIMCELLAKDPVPLVAETAAWSVGKILKNHVDEVDPTHVQPAVETLRAALKHASPKVAQVVTTAIGDFAQGVEESSSVRIGPFLGPLLGSLVEAADREDADDCSLTANVYINITFVLEAADPAESDEVLRNFLTFICKRLGELLQPGGASELPAQLEKRVMLQQYVCGALVTLIPLCEAYIVSTPTLPEAILQLIYNVFRTGHSGAHDDGMLALSHMISVMEERIVSHVPNAMNFIGAGIQNPSSVALCSASVGALSDLLRVSPASVRANATQLVQLLLQHVADNELDRSLKPPILTLLGDIAFNLPDVFVPFLQPTLNALVQASKIMVDEDPEDEDFVEFVEQLHVSVLEAYMALLQAYRDQAAQLHVLQPYMGEILEFVCRVSGSGGEVDETVVRSAACVVGDACHVFGAATKPYLMRPETQQLLKLFEQLTQEGGTDRHKEQLAWLQSLYNKIVTAA